MSYRTFYSPWLFLALQPLARANPISPSGPLYKRNVCDGVNATPVIDKLYLGDTCPAKYIMNSQGVCDHMDASENGCAAFCQVSTEFNYHTEEPLTDTYCHGPLTCAVADTKTVTVTWSGNINANFDKGIKAGITGGWSRANANAHAVTRTINLQANECGYFTLVPVWKNTCGSITSKQMLYNPGGGADTGVPEGYYCSYATPTTIGNYCVPQIRTNPDGSADVETIFVRTDCGNREPLPADKQDPIYNKPGVPLDRGSCDTLSATWAEVGEASTASSPSQDTCDVSYKFFYDSFEVRGKNFDETKLGDNGSGLEHQIGGCGDITDWSFKMTPDDPTYMWYASGHLPIGTKDCVGHAVETAGGSTEGDCHGAG